MYRIGDPITTAREFDAHVSGLETVRRGADWESVSRTTHPCGFGTYAVMALQQKKPDGGGECMVRKNSIEFPFAWRFTIHLMGSWNTEDLAESGTTPKFRRSYANVFQETVPMWLDSSGFDTREYSE
jgi:hypothetical protein